MGLEAAWCASSPRRPNHKRVPRSRKVRVGRRLGMRRGSWFSVAVCGFLITLARAKRSPFGKLSNSRSCRPLRRRFRSSSLFGRCVEGATALPTSWPMCRIYRRGELGVNYQFSNIVLGAECSSSNSKSRSTAWGCPTMPSVSSSCAACFAWHAGGKTKLKGTRQLDEVLHALGDARNKLTRIDEKQPEEIERGREHIRKGD